MTWRSECHQNIPGRGHLNLARRLIPQTVKVKEQQRRRNTASFSDVLRSLAAQGGPGRLRGILCVNLSHHEVDAVVQMKVLLRVQGLNRTRHH